MDTESGKENCAGAAAHEMAINLVVACTMSGGIGKDGRLPWNLPEDLRLFSRLTTTTKSSRRQNAVVMGRLTWESLPYQHRPLKNRLNIIISSSMSPEFCPQGVYVVKSVDASIRLLQGQLKDQVEDCFFIGGTSVFSEVLANHLETVSYAYMTRIAADIQCDVYMSPLPTESFLPISVSPTRSSGEVPYDFVVYKNVRRFAEHHNRQAVVREDTEDSDVSLNFATDVENKSCSEEQEKSDYPFSVFLGAQRETDTIPCLPSLRFRGHQECSYLDLVKEVIESGVYSEDRTGVGTQRLFGKSMRFDLSHSFPLFTTKRVFWKGVVEELLWFVKGSTNGNILTEKGVKIWEANGSRTFLDARGLHHHEVGDLGPVYGFQWRHSGAEYVDMRSNYSGKGVDQLKGCIEAIRNNPESRRIIVCAWNPTDIPKMALPPCHMMFQFFVCDGKLSCCMYQRSCDLGLGVPFNVASYSLLTLMIAKMCNLQPGEFIHFLGDAHVYANHVDALKTQLQRLPRPFPIVVLPEEAPQVVQMDHATPHPHFHSLPRSLCCRKLKISSSVTLRLLDTILILKYTWRWLCDE